jgi:hypothetical protein
MTVVLGWGMSGLKINCIGPRSMHKAGRVWASQLECVGDTSEPS